MTTVTYMYHKIIMAKKISKSKFKPRSLEYFRKIEESGEEMIITDHGRPVLKITPYSEELDEVLKHLRNTVTKYKNPTEPVGKEDWESLK